MALKQLYINGTGSGTCGVYINTDTYLNSPALDLTEYQIPAVNGNQVAYNKRLNNVVRRFDCFINDNVETNLQKFKKLLYDSNGYMKIESDYDTDTYQYGYLAQEIQVAPFRMNQQVQFSLYFSCMPQKWFITNNTITNIMDVAASDVYYVFTKTYQYPNGNLSMAFNSIPIDQQPTDDYYAVMYFVPTVQSGNTITNISITSDKSGFVAMMCIGANDQNQSDLICYGYGSASRSSYTVPAIDTWVSVCGVFSVTDSPTITASIKYQNNTVVTRSFDPTNFSKQISNQNAFGVDFDMILSCNIEQNPGSTRNSTVVLSSSYLSSKKNEALYIIHFDNMNSDLLDELYNEYSYPHPSIINYYLVDILIDADNNACAIKGTKKLDLTSFLEVSGTINGRCDNVTEVVYKLANYTGDVHRSTLQPRWWKL